GSPLDQHPIETSRGNADHVECGIVDGECLAHDLWVGTQSTPETIADHYDRMRAWRLSLFGSECPSHRSLHAERLEIIGRHSLTGHTLRSISNSQIQHPRGKDTQVREDTVLIAIVGIVRIRIDVPDEMRI